MYKSIATNTAALVVVQVANYIAPLIILLHLTKTLGVEIYGVLAFSQGLMTTGFILVDFGYGMSATNKVSKNRGNQLYISKILSGTIVVKAVIYTIYAICVIIYAYTTEKYSEYWLIFILSLFPLAAQAAAPLWLFHGLEKMKYYAAISVFTKIIFAALCVLFIVSPLDYYLVPVFNGISQSMALIASIFYLHKNGYSLITPSLRLIAYCYNFSKQFFLSRVAVASYMNGGVLALGLSANPIATATYSMAEQLYKVMQTALGPVAAAAYPYMANRKELELMIKLIILVIAAASAGAVVGYFVSPTLLNMLFDVSWQGAIPILNVFLIAIVIHAATIMMGYPLAALLERLDVANFSVMTGAGAYFILLGFFYFIELISPISLAYIMMVSELSVLLHRSIVMIPAIKNQLNKSKRKGIK